MKLYIFVVREPGFSDDDAYITEDCWDECAVDDNEEGFQDRFAELKTEYGVDNVRIMVVKIPVGSLKKVYENVCVAGILVRS